MLNPTGSVQKQDITGFYYHLSSIEERLMEIIQLLQQALEVEQYKLAKPDTTISSVSTGEGRME